MLLLPPRSTLFPYTRSSDLEVDVPVVTASQRGDDGTADALGDAADGPPVALGRAREPRFDHVHPERDRKSTRLNSSHTVISYAVFCLKKKIKCVDRIVHMAE